MLETNKVTGIPLAEGLEHVVDLPHTITYAINYRTKINSLQELPKDMQPPRNLWDKPYLLSEFLDEKFSDKGTGSKKATNFIEYDFEDVE